MNPGVDKYLTDGCGRCPLGSTPNCKVNRWQNELNQLRSILIDCGLTEELKWSVPCYTYQTNFGKKAANIVIMAALKEYCALGFFKGSLLQDTECILIKPGENSQSNRQLRFKNVREILELEAVIKAYIFEAIEIERAGLKVNFKKTNEYKKPDELINIFNENPLLKDAFNALTPGRQRGYVLHFSQAKQSETRLSRIEKCIPDILKGKGLNER